MSPTNSYRILELSVGASQPDVRAAYHRLVRQWHPDKFHDDPDTKIIAERKIREIIGAYTHLSNSDVTQRHADVVPDDATDADRGEHSPPRSSTNDVFYTNLEEAIRSGTSTFAGQPQDSSADTASTRQQAATESQGTGRAACAYVDGDPRLEHISTGLLGCSAAVTWNSSGVTLNTENGTSVSYPARSIRSVRLALRSSLAFLSEGIVRIQVTDPASVRNDGFFVKLRFRDRSMAELFASQLAMTCGVETIEDKGWSRIATLLILLLVVLIGLGISIGIRAKYDPMAAKPADEPVVTGNADRDRGESKPQIAVVAQQAAERAEAVARPAAVVEIERSGGSVIQNQGRVVRVILAGARVNDSLLACISRLQDLEELNLHAATIAGEEFRHLSGLSNLRVLDLGSTRNASAGVKSLVGLTRLQVLRLSNTDVSDADLKLLAQLPDLEELEVIGTQVTEIGIRDFNAARPDCVVVR